MEAALELKRPRRRVTVVTMGPDGDRGDPQGAVDGRGHAVHLTDEALRGLGRGRDRTGDWPGRSGRSDEVDLVLAGNEASDGRSAAVPAMVAEVLGVPALTHARKVAVEGSAR